LEGPDVLDPGTAIKLLVGELEAAGTVDGLGLPTVEDATGVVERIELPSADTVPDKPMLVAAFASGLAVRGNPKTLQILAMAPKVAGRSQIPHTSNSSPGAFWLITDLAGYRQRDKPDRYRHSDDQHRSNWHKDMAIVFGHSWCHQHWQCMGAD
jgi:hypothetical protein